VTVAFWAVLAALGFVGAFVSGLLGLGGAIVTIPLLLYVPPLVGVGVLDIKTVSGITMVQVLAGSTTGLLAHYRHGTVHGWLAVVSGSAMAAGTFAGAVGSRYVHGDALLGVFAVLVTGAAALMLVPTPSVDPEMLAGEVRFNPRLAASIGVGVGIIAGMVGAGGAFLLVPLMLAVVRVPLRVALGTSLASAAIGAVAGFLGKLVTAQIVFALALPVVAGALLGSPLGASTSRRASPRALRVALFAALGITAARVWYDLLGW
jgi:uncharacterized membrane protein YfcA